MSARPRILGFLSLFVVLSCVAAATAQEVVVPPKLLAGGGVLQVAFIHCASWWLQAGLALAPEDHQRRKGEGWQV